MTFELVNADWREAAWPEKVDVLLTDPPYSERTTSGQRTGSSVDQSTIQYTHMTQEGAEEIAAFWSQRVRWWAIIFGDHVAYRWHEAAWKRAGWYVFAPIGYVKKNPPPRMCGDGPTTSVEHIMVARPRHRLPKDRSGSRRGDYTAVARVKSLGVAGMKSVNAVAEILIDYCIDGDTVADPFAGAGTVGAAEKLVPNLHIIGAEIDPKAYDIAVERLKLSPVHL